MSRNTMKMTSDYGRAERQPERQQVRQLSFLYKGVADSQASRNRGLDRDLDQMLEEWESSSKNRRRISNFEKGRYWYEDGRFSRLDPPEVHVQIESDDEGDLAGRLDYGDDRQQEENETNRISG